MTQNGDNGGKTDKTPPEPPKPLREAEIVKKGTVPEPPIPQPLRPKED